MSVVRGFGDYGAGVGAAEGLVDQTSVCTAEPPMMLTVTIVESAPVEEAEERFRFWREEHPRFMAIATDRSIIVTHIRGGGTDGAIVGKRRYSVVLDDVDAAALVAESELLLDVVVVDAKAPRDADHEFEAWWSQRPSLQRILGQDGYIMDDVTVVSPLRSYRVRVQQRNAAFLARG